MTALLYLTFVTPVLLVCLWLAATALQAVVGEEAIGQVKRLARVLVKRAARSLPPDERETFIRDVLAELDSDELEDRPLSQLLMAIDLWIHSSGLRPGGSEVVRRLRQRLGSTLVWCSGADARILSYVPAERGFATALGGSVLLVGGFSGSAVAFVAGGRLFLDPPVAAFAGVVVCALVVLIERFLLVVEFSTWRRSWVSFFWSLSLQIMLAYLVAETVKLVLLQPVVLEPSVLGDGLSPQYDRSSEVLTEGVGQLVWIHGREALFEGMLDVILMAIVCTPYVALLLRRLGGPRPIYDLVSEELRKAE